jgi:hypothetical protein
MQKNFSLNKFFVAVLKVNDENEQDPDPHQNVIDPQHWPNVTESVQY